jgi:hypothetical protein
MLASSPSRDEKEGVPDDLPLNEQSGSSIDWGDGP